MTHLKVGDKAPDFTGKNQDGKKVSLSNYLTDKVILYFYPKDDTPGCTKQACNLSENYSALIKKGFSVIGVSPDNESSHQKFVKKYDLPFELIADINAKICRDYGVFGKKKFMENTNDNTFLLYDTGHLLFAQADFKRVLKNCQI